MSKVMKLSVFGMLALLVYVQPAAAREFADIYTECGLGAIIAPRNAAVAAVTNVTWDSGTTAISSNITSPSTCNGGEPRTAAFIHNSYKSIEGDLASGNGTYLDTLATLSGCSEKDQQKLKLALREDFAKVVADPGYTNKSRLEKSEILYNLLYKNSETVKQS